MKRLFSSMVRTWFLLLAASQLSVFAQGDKAKLSVPADLVGTWESETKDIILVLTEDGVVFTDKSSGVEQIYEGAISLYFDKPGYLAFTLDKATSDGTDATEMYKSMGPQFYIAFQTQTTGEGTISVNFAGGGRGLVDEANLKSTDNIQNPQDWLNPKTLKKADTKADKKKKKSKKKKKDTDNED